MQIQQMPQNKTQQLAMVQKQREDYLIATRLDAQDQKIVSFFNAPMVNDLESKDLKLIIDSAISSALQDLGKLIDDNDDVTYMTEQLFIFLKDKHSSMRINEIKIALQRGVAKEYGDFYGFNVASLKGFINAYMSNALRLEAMKKLMAIKQAININIEPTDEEKQQQIKQNIIKSFNIFKANAWYNDLGNVVFTELYNAGIFSFTDEETVTFYRIAKKRLIDFYSSDTGITFIDKRQKRSRITALANIKGEAMLNDLEIVSEANRVALNHYYKKMVLSGSEIEELLEFIS